MAMSYPDVEKQNLDSPYKQERVVTGTWKITFLDISSQAGPAIEERRCSRGAAVGTWIRRQSGDRGQQHE